MRKPNKIVTSAVISLLFIALLIAFFMVNRQLRTMETINEQFTILESAFSTGDLMTAEKSAQEIIGVAPRILKIKHKRNEGMRNEYLGIQSAFAENMAKLKEAILAKDTKIAGALLKTVGSNCDECHLSFKNF